MRTRIVAGLASGLFLLTAATATAQEAAGTVYVVHGVPGLPDGSNVDVYANGSYDRPLLGGDDADFRFGDVAGPVELPAGDYELEIFAAGADPAATDPALTTSGPVTLPAGANVTIVAGLTGDGQPSLFVLPNDVSTIAPGKARVTVAHTAAAPAVDVLVGEDTALFTDLAAGGDTASAEVDAGTVPNVRVTAAGDPGTVAIDAGDLTFAEGTAYTVYAIGSLTDGTLTAVTIAIAGLHSTPTGVPSGDAGLAATDTAAWLVVLAALGALLLAAPVVAHRRR